MGQKCGNCDPNENKETNFDFPNDRSEAYNIYMAKSNLPPPTANKQQVEKYSDQFDKELEKYGYKISLEELENAINPIAKKIQSQLPLLQIAEADIPRKDSTFSKPPIYFTKEKIFYHGNWNINGKKHGLGKLVKPDGCLFEGTFIDDEIDGYGRYINLQGDYYEGY